MRPVLRMTAKQAAIMAISATLYAVFFQLSRMVPGLPAFVVLYLPAILLGVFPLWFGFSGLFGSMIGAYIGGVFVENLPLHLAWAESVCTFMIFGLNWLLIPKSSAQAKTERGLVLLFVIYTLTLLAGTAYILWQITAFGIITAEMAVGAYIPTILVNLPIQLVLCPALIRAVSPRLKGWGIYSGTFSERRNRSKSKAESTP